MCGLLGYGKNLGRVIFVNVTTLGSIIVIQTLFYQKYLELSVPIFKGTKRSLQPVVVFNYTFKNL